MQLTVSQLVRTSAHITNPAVVIQKLLRHTPGLQVPLKVELDLFERPYYAYGVYMAADQARRLGTKAISVIEFGVAAGSGLLALERLSDAVEQWSKIRIDVYGFDLGEGLPAVADYRDMPYVFQQGFYKMDERALRERLRKSRLVFGNVRETVPQFIASLPAPVGFIAFDLDYYTSTVDAMGVFNGDLSIYLPRVYCYFDDILSYDHCVTSEYSGELLAIGEFNARGSDMKISPPNGLALTRVIPAAWNSMMYVCHLFQHPLYNQYIASDMTAFVLPKGGRRAARTRRHCGESAIR